MDPILFSSSRHLRRVYQRPSNLMRAIRPSRTYTISTVCASCRAKASRPSTHENPTRRWASQATVLKSSLTINTPFESNAPKTHYEFFPETLPAGPPPTGPFTIDIRQLRKEYLQLQAVAHPDQHPQELKGRAEATSSRINEAYKTLQNPLLRAQYLLSLRGIDVAKDETAKVEDPELLMEVLDTREEIEEAEEEDDLRELRLDNDDRIRKSEIILDGAFRDDDMGVAKEEAVRLRYWVNIKESLDGWEQGKPLVLSH